MMGKVLGLVLAELRNGSGNGSIELVLPCLGLSRQRFSFSCGLSFSRFTLLLAVGCDGGLYLRRPCEAGNGVDVRSIRSGGRLVAHLLKM
jgi:hypothetical protein